LVSRISAISPYEWADRKSYWLNDDNPLAAVELQSDQPNLIVVGPDITLTAVPDGTTSLYEYQFLVKGGAPTASWSVLRDFGPDPTFSVSSTAFLGKNRFQVRARNQGTLDQEVRDGQVVWVTKRYCAGLLPGSVVLCYDWS